MALPGRFKAIALTAGSPTLSAPDMYVYRAPPIEFFDGQVEVVSDWQLGDPEVWPLNTLKLDPEDGIPIKEALFANHNADMALSIDELSLVGRTALLRGPAHKIKVDAPLTFSNRRLGLDPAFKPGGGEVPPSVAFRAHKNGVQQTGIVKDVPTKLTFPTEVYDIGGFYDPALSRWTPPLGLVHIEAMTWFSAGVSGTAQISIWKNGVILARGVNTSPSSSDGVLVSIDDVANGTDYYEIFSLLGGNNAAASGAPELTYFCGHVPSGQQGVQGIQGPIGITGPVGPQGIQGVKGDKGDLGNTGPQGIQGPQGVQGNVGPRGPTGDQGNPGALWYQGAGTPAAALAAVGDFYLRLSTGDVYQKVNPTTWTLFGNIKGPTGITGPQGPTGADSFVPGPKGDVGSLWYDGAGAPAGTLARDGDYYLNRTSGDVYLKTAGVWSVVTNVRGPQGIQGNQGVVGPQGSVWYTGTSVPAVGTGVDGDYYFYSSNQEIWKKTAGTWAKVSSLVAGGPPIAFRACVNAAQGLSTGYNKVQFPTEEIDQGNYYDAANSRWTPPAGLVQLEATVFITGSLQVGSNMHCVVYKNGANWKEGSTHITGATSYFEASIAIIDLASGADTYEIYVYTPVATSASVFSSGQYSFFSGYSLTGQGPKGDTGSQGPSGGRWFSGAVAPDVGTGVDSDYYLNTTDATVWKKVGSTWTQIGVIAGGASAVGFRASHNATQNFTGPTAFKISFATEEYDRGGYYNPANSRWTPPAGLVHISASVYMTSGGNNSMATALWVYKNGAAVKQEIAIVASGNSYQDLHIKCDDVASGTDYYEIFITNDNAAASTLDARATVTWFCGHVVSAQGPKGDIGPVSTVPGPQGPIGPASTVPGPVGPPATYPTGAHGFTAQKTADQSIPSNTWTKVDFGLENYDTGGQYYPATSRYTPVAGDAFFVASVYCSGLLTGSNVYLAIYKNGTIFRAATNNTTNNSAQIVCTDNANGTDYYEAWVYATATGANFTIPASEINLNFFQGFQPVGPTGPQGPAGFGIVQIGTTPPASPSVGNFWYDTSTGILSLWIDDGSSSQWIQVSPTINLDTSNYVGINSPAFLGTPTAPTAVAGTNTTQVATTAFAKAQAEAALAAEAVRYDAAQSLTAPQQAQARSNIAAAQATAFDTAWKPFPYVNGWIDYGAPYSAGYRLLPSGLVLLRGLCKNGSATTMFILPAGYRPSATGLFCAECSPNVLCRVDVSADGSVAHTGGNAGWVSLSGISFLAEN